MDKNTSAFWKFTKHTMNGQPSHHSTTPITKSNGELTTNPSEKAQTLLNQFCPIEKEERKDGRTELYKQIIQDAIDNNEIHPLNLPISITELNISINGLPNKAMGRDKVHNEMITKLDKENRCTLLELLNISFSSGYLPPEWKNAIVVPIPKPNKPPNLPDSYRPISLTSCLCKVLQ